MKSWEKYDVQNIVHVENVMASVTGSRMNCNVTTVEGLPSSAGLNSS